MEGCSLAEYDAEGEQRRKWFLTMFLCDVTCKNYLDGAARGRELGGRM